MRNYVAGMLLACGWCGGANAYVIDGDLSDWGLGRAGQASDWAPTPGVVYQVEDFLGGSTGQVGPGFGGQAYDAEALYLNRDQDNLYIALVTGHDPATPDRPNHNQYAPGDFAINFFQGSNDHTFEFGIDTNGDNGLVQGGVYQVQQWDTGLPQWSAVEPHVVTSIRQGTQLGTAQLAVSGPYTSQGARPSDSHWAYELSVPLALFSGYMGQSLELLWTMNCANDSIHLILDEGLIDVAEVPEPPALLLLGTVLPLMLRRRKRS